MNKPELIAAAAEKTGLPKKDAEALVNAVLDTISATLAAGEKVQLSGFGTFEVKTRQARVGRNPHTKEHVHIPATRVPQFKPSQGLKENVAK